MSLIAMAVHDTDENERTLLTDLTIKCLLRTVDKEHRIIIVDNGSCDETKRLLRMYGTDKMITVITNETNIGTAAAINLAWTTKRPGENLIKMDNDVVIHSAGWVDELDRAIERDPQIGIIGLKRKDLIENPWRLDAWQSELHMLSQHTGEPWIIVEKVKHVIGTCQMYSAALIEKIGYLYQPGLYGYDDVLACHRSQIAGFYNCFLPHIEIDHIDNKETPHWQWKRDEAEKKNFEQQKTVSEYLSGKRPIYYDPYD